jgi:ribose 1,5-bisphosphokinase
MQSGERNDADCGDIGALVLIVGPSGAGKDTVIDGAKRAFETTGELARVLFPKRSIDRPSHPSEDFVSVPSHVFDSPQVDDAFALHWSAHGTRYGIPASIRETIAEGGVAVVNVSRTVIPAARAAFSRVVVIAITCPPDVRAQRLAERARETRSEIASRVARTVPDFDPAQVDHVIDNSGAPEQAIDALVNILRAVVRPVATS